MPRFIGAKLRYLRSRRGITQMDVVHQSGIVSQGHLTRLENDKDMPSLRLVLGLAHFFQVTTDYLLRDTIPVDEVVEATRSAEADTIEPRLFGPKLRALRQARNFTQKRLASELHLATHAYINNLEAQRKWPSADLVVAIADLFGVTTDYLLRDELPIIAL